LQLAGLACECCLAQETPSEPRPSETPPTVSEREAAAEAQAHALVLERYNISLGQGGINLSAGLQGLYVDNVFLTHTDTKDDYILVPQLNAGLFYPIGRLNTLRVDLGLAYYYYFKNTGLNSDFPSINPNSQLEFNIYTGDFQITLSEAFSYQEIPFYETGGQFYNVYGTGRFARYLNRVGAAAKWDLHHLVLDAGYHHEDLLSNGSEFNYIDRHSELFDVDALLNVSPVVAVGLEGAGSLNSYDHVPLNDHWRAAIGPALRLRPSENLTARLGAGYQRIEYDSNLDSLYGLSGFNTYYAYAGLEHQINRFFNQAAKISHDNQLGINAANLEGTHVTYTLSWTATERIRVSPYFEYSRYEESYGPDVSGLYREVFDYYAAGLAATYTVTQNWRLNLNYDYRLKDSQTPSSGYAQNRVALRVDYQF
jgi:hypothetical protein